MKNSPTSGMVLAFLAVIGVTFSGCKITFNGIKGSGVAATEERLVDEFNAVSLSGAATVNINCGQEQHDVTLTVDDNLIELMETDVSKGELEIGCKQAYSTTMGLEVDVNAAMIDRFECSGACTTTIVNVDADKFVIDVSGAGSLKVVGKANDLVVNVSGASKLDLSELAVVSATVDLSGASKATVNASESLKVDLSGVGKVSYLGNPTVDKDISGLGKVKKIDSE